MIRQTATMPGLRTHSQLLGFDVSQMLHELRTAWCAMLAWPVLTWLQPKLPVRLWLSKGHSVASRGPGTPHRNDNMLAASRFNAILLPEQLLLRSHTHLPALQPHDLLAALQLQVSGLNPFALDDLVWTHQVAPRQAATDGSIQVQLALTARTHITRYLAQTYPDIDPDRAEVWLPGMVPYTEQLLPGFGEAARLRIARRWRWVRVLLALTVLTLVVAMAVTPTAQLYLRAQQAYAAMEVLQLKAKPVLQQREALVKSTDQLGNLAQLTGKQLPPLRILKLITDALPDDTSLTALQVQGLKVSMTGQTVNSAALMKQLGATAGLRDVVAPTPAVKPLGAPRESFSIEFTLDPAQLGATP